MKRFFAIFLGLAMLLSTPALAEPGDVDVLRRAGLEALDACVDGAMTDLEKLTALHDWLALRCDYGDPQNGTTAYDAMINGKAVCTGYAAALAYLYDLAGLQGADTYSAEMDHAWALATLEGVRYFSDCVWDDGKAPTIGLIRHTYWLFDENTAGKLWHYGWDSPEHVPGSGLQAAPWGAAMTRVIFHGDYAYYIDNDFRLLRCHRGTWQEEQLFQINALWPAATPEEGQAEVATGLVLIGRRLYFNTPYAICSVNLTGRGLKTHLRPDTSAGLVFGLDVREGKLCYALAEGPDALHYEIQETDIPAGDAWGY